MKNSFCTHTLCTSVCFGPRIQIGDHGSLLYLADPNRSPKSLKLFVACGEIVNETRDSAGKPANTRAFSSACQRANRCASSGAAANDQGFLAKRPLLMRLIDGSRRRPGIRNIRRGIGNINSSRLHEVSMRDRVTVWSCE